MSRQNPSNNSPDDSELLEIERVIAADLRKDWKWLPMDRRQACFEYYPPALMALAGVKLDEPYEQRRPMTHDEFQEMQDAMTVEDWPGMTQSERRFYRVRHAEELDRLGLKLEDPYIPLPPDPDWE